MTLGLPPRPLLLAFPLLALLLPPLLSACGGEAGRGPSPAVRPWGEAVAGLSLGLDAARTRWTGQERVVFTVRARNAGAGPLRLHAFEDETWWYLVRFENLDGGPSFLGGAGLFIDFAAPPDRTLAPGETWEKEADLTLERRRFLRIVPDRRPGDDWDYRAALPPGRYRACVEYAWEGAAGAEGYWRGRARSNEVEVEVR